MCLESFFKIWASSSLSDAAAVTWSYPERPPEMAIAICAAIATGLFLEISQKKIRG
jgi:hypothetical protein